MAFSPTILIVCSGAWPAQFVCAFHWKLCRAFSANISLIDFDKWAARLPLQVLSSCFQRMVHTWLLSKSSTDLFWHIVSTAFSTKILLLFLGGCRACMLTNIFVVPIGGSSIEFPTKNSFRARSTKAVSTKHTAHALGRIVWMVYFGDILLLLLYRTPFFGYSPPSGQSNRPIMLAVASCILAFANNA